MSEISIEHIKYLTLFANRDSCLKRLFPLTPAAQASESFIQVMFDKNCEIFLATLSRCKQKMEFNKETTSKRSLKAIAMLRL